MFLHDLAGRGLPQVVPAGIKPEEWPEQRNKIIELFGREVYGLSPPTPQIGFEVESGNKRDWAGKAEYRRIKLGFAAAKGDFSFPVDIVLPESAKKLPLVIYISFTPYLQGPYVPFEEIVDSRYALAMFYYNDVSKDEDDGFASGLGAVYERDDSDGTAWGKISMWAWAASRVMDFAQGMEEIDSDRIYCVGHSRLGKTALWCAAQDTRFAGAGVNNSGCGGVAVSRGKQGESIANIVERFPFWFCKNFHKYAGREEHTPFEQSMLASMIAPRPLAVSNAVEDTWCDPMSEYMSLWEASKAYEFLGVPGFLAPAAYPLPGQVFADGRLGFNLRSGTHFLSRHDWLFYLNFFNNKSNIL